jgi:hypothetical protein
MHAVRQIIDDAPDTIPVPPEMRHKRIEILFLPLDEAPTEKDAHGWPIGFFEATAGAWEGEPLTREPQGEYEQRLELD